MPDPLAFTVTQAITTAGVRKTSLYAAIKRGELRVQFDLQGFERMVAKLARASNSLTVGIVIAGLLVASSLVLRAGSVTVAYAGFASGLALSLWLVWNMTRD